ncbi:5-methylcytosine restriction system specificity protein McrC [Mobiluncus porci]|uniref:5-methylcytosine restriction system specificity protein McrC n=1 Tax=Mobiluncus porci TaxID=2652278 RepID=UPI0038998028
MLSLGIGRQIKQGLHREYLETQDELATIRGRVDMPGTIRNRPGNAAVRED